MLYSFRNRQPRIGQETYVSDQAILIGDVKIGDDCYIGPGAMLRGDYGSIEVGDGTAVEEGVMVHSPPDQVCRFGKKVTVGHGAIIHSSIIGDLTVIGMGAIVSIGAEVGDETIVAEGSVIRMNQKIPPAVIVGGNPAKVIRPLTEENRKFTQHGNKLYIDLAHEYAQGGIKRID